VAHHVSLIGVQAGAARTALDRSPDQTRHALEGIEASSRAAVGEMRQLLDVMAPMPGPLLASRPSASDGSAAGPDGHDERVPLPGLERLPDLVARWRDAGLAVDESLAGDPTHVAPGASLCAYRIVEEALTNVVRHSQSAVASLRVVIDAASVRVSG
jgi:signal transduction histidine kinase